MNPMKLKVCGLTLSSQVLALIQMQVDFLGFIFYSKSPRFVLKTLKPEQISTFSHTGKVGVFVNENLENMVSIARTAGLQFLQLHGDEHLEIMLRLKEQLPDCKLIKVVRVGEDFRQFQTQFQEIPKQAEFADFFLFDTATSMYGGSGKNFNWQWLSEIEIPKPYFLSGGIQPEHAEDLLKISPPPFAVDVNSGFEIQPGAKDLQKIQTLQRILQTF